MNQSNMFNVTELRATSQAQAEQRAAKGIVFVLDDDPSIRSSYERLFTLEGFVCFAYDSAEALITGRTIDAERLNGPRCLLCDVSLPGKSGLDVQEALGSEQAMMPFIFISGVSSEVEVVQAYRKGGYAFLLKPIDISELLATVSSAMVLSGNRQQESAELARLQAMVMQLTERERAVIKLVLEGCTNPQISDRLRIALRTVKVHRQHAMQKLGAKNLVELTRTALRSSILC